MTDVTVRLRPLDAGIPAALVETSSRVVFAADPADPVAAFAALAALIQERFDSGAWSRQPPASS